jgi:hypothetical protein
MLSFGDLDRLRDMAGRMGWPVPSDAQSDAIFGRLQQQLLNDPLVKRYVQHLNAGNSPRNTEPWQAVGEQRYAAFLVLGAAMPNSGVSFAYLNETAPKMLAVTVALRILMAQPYLWQTEVEDLIRAAPLPEHILSRQVLPYPAMFFSYETSYGWNAAEGIEFQGTRFGGAMLQALSARLGVNRWDHVELNWQLLFDVQDGCSIVHDMTGGGKCALAQIGFHYGWRYPQDFPEGPERAGLSVLLKRLAFIKSPFVVTEQQRLPRPIRRELQRLQPGKTEPVVNVVRLRRALVEPRPGDAQEPERDSPAWRHHWWVTGHFRAQWMPSTRSHNVIWIAPYVKGPLDKPLLDRVYVVDR